MIRFFLFFYFNPCKVLIINGIYLTACYKKPLEIITLYNKIVT